MDNDDWNDKPAPYDFVRPTGRIGSCYTNQYRAGAEYLVFLKKKQDGTLTTETSRLELMEQVLRHFLVPIPSHA